MTAVPEGQTMNTDQRLALLMLGLQENLDREVKRLRQEERYWKDQPTGVAMSEVLERQKVHIGNASDRLEQIIKALAAGTLRIEDEGPSE